MGGLGVLVLGNPHSADFDAAGLLGSSAEIEEVASPLRALALLARGGYTALYIDADHLAEATNLGRLIQHDRVLRGMPNGVVLLDRSNTILYENGRLAEWAETGNVVGRRFYDVMSHPEIMGARFLPVRHGVLDGEGEQLDAAVVVGAFLPAARGADCRRGGRAAGAPGGDGHRRQRRDGPAAEAGRGSQGG